MKRFAVALALSLSLVPAFAEDAVPEAAREWSWSEERASLARCVKRELSKDEACLVEDGKLAILKDGKKVLELALHENTSLARAGTTLLVAEFSRAASGGAVAAHDLATGKLLWRTNLEGLGTIFHSAYLNAITLEVIEKVVVARGNESAGRYVECLDLATGKQRLHTKLPSIAIPEAAKEWRFDEKLASLDATAKTALAKPFDFWIQPKESSRSQDTCALHVSRPARPAIKIDALHAETPIARKEEVLVVAEHGPISSGCALAAHDLVTGKLLWRRHLIGIGPTAHSKYRNRVNLEIVDGFVVARGEESHGNYVEVLEVETGVRVWHKRFD
jgi:hypothetical protein